MSMTRTLLLSLHILSVAAWIGADILHHAVDTRLVRQGPEVRTAWARVQLWLHQRYYPVPAMAVLATGVLLVIDGDWSWSSGFIWVGVAAIVGGATLGGGGLGSLSKRRLAALEAGDEATADALRRRMVPITVVLFLLPLIALVAMVHKWKAA